MTIFFKKTWARIALILLGLGIICITALNNVTPQPDPWNYALLVWEPIGWRQIIYYSSGLWYIILGVGLLAWKDKEKLADAEQSLRLSLENTKQRLISEVKDNSYAIAGLILLALVAYGFVAFNLTTSGDDWLGTLTSNFGYRNVAAQGRWLMPVGWETLGQNLTAHTFNITLLGLSTFISIWLQIQTIGLKNKYAKFAFAAVFMLFPIWGGVIVLRMAAAPMIMGMFFGAAYGYQCHLAAKELLENNNFSTGVKHALFAILFFSLAASVMQQFILLGAIPYIANLLYRAVQKDNNAPPINVKQEFMRLAILGGVIIAGIGLYFAEVAAGRWYYSIEALSAEQGYTLHMVSTPAELLENLENFKIYILQFLFKAQHLFPASAKYIFLAFLGMLLLYLFALRPDRPPKPLRLLLLALSVLAIIIIPWAIGIVAIADTYRYTSLVINAASYAAIISIVLDRVEKYWPRLILNSAAFILILIFTFQQNAAAITTYFINQRDMAIVNRILDRIETHPDYEIIEQAKGGTIIAIGYPDVPSDRPFTMPLTDLPMNTSMVECGIFNCEHGEYDSTVRIPQAAQLIQYSTNNYSYIGWETLDEESRQRLTPLIEGRPAWPHADSLIISEQAEIILIFEPLDEVD